MTDGTGTGHLQCETYRAVLKTIGYVKGIFRDRKDAGMISFTT